jgi:hypothetical protein
MKKLTRERVVPTLARKDWASNGSLRFGRHITLKKRSDPRIASVQHQNCQSKYVGFQASLNREVAAATTPFPRGAKVRN